MIRGPASIPWGHAKRFCEDRDMEIPNPKNAELNHLYAGAGPTWLDINVNDIFNAYDDGYKNWRKKQRGFMTRHGRWVNRLATDRLPFYCVYPGL